jgi:hypothetical protein
MEGGCGSIGCSCYNWLNSSLRFVVGLILRSQTVEKKQAARNGSRASLISVPTFTSFFLKRKESD